MFALDLNCAIYHCVKKLQSLCPYTEETQKAWEASLHEHVVAYIKQMVRNVTPTEKVYIAVDGVAPAAKIKQQRMRRFKSAVSAEQEARIKAEARGEAFVEKPRWDTNAITPGTQFMTGLATALRMYARTDPVKIIVSAADEPGEGEQKIMTWAREYKPASMVVYGLDADLIVLALWATATSSTAVDLYREETEFNGAVKTNATDEEQFLYLDVAHLGRTLYAAHGRADQFQADFLCDFVGLMNLLGNDFVPHGMALKIRDDGVQQLLEIQKTLSSPIVRQSTDGTWHYNVAALRTIFATLASRESTALLRNVKKKLEARVGATAGKTVEERALALCNDLPVTWAAESVLVDRVLLTGSDHPMMKLKPDWTTIYDTHALMGATPESAVKYYLEALAWTLAYYSGAPVDLYWYYPWFLPPRFSTLHTALESCTKLATPNKVQTPLLPQEQLAMVLPQSSFSLLPPEYKRLVKLYPQYWPNTWGTYSFGRRFLWECEPLLPLLQPSTIKGMVEIALDA